MKKAERESIGRICVRRDPGIVTCANKEDGHGQGAEISIVPEHSASYALLIGMSIYPP
ncbi:DUF7014 domain-containing protein [Candidatus Thiosymbion oneisti]|uniref:DUF7014 domain-containing protein n=1 Tax=Candidatus Thiosymbion oneisti TaxID=589554 RepID=UPI003F706CA1